MFTKSGQIDWITKMRQPYSIKAYFIHEHETARAIDGVPLGQTQSGVFLSERFVCCWMLVDPATGATAMGVEGQISAFEMMRMMAMTEINL